MNRREHLLTILAEECSELAQETSKAIRFGINEQRDLPTSNRERMHKEFNDILALIAMLNDEEPSICVGRHEKMIRDKKAKVETYLLYSKELGTYIE